MKTKISVFITATVLFLLLGVTNTIAQGSKIYFKKNGVTVFQSAISEIDSIKFAVDKNKTVTSVTVTPETSEIPKGYALEFTATVNGKNLTEMDKAVTWTVTGGTSKETAISTDGILSVSAAETSENLTITATSTVDNSKRGTASIKVYEYQNFYEDATEGSEIVEIEMNGEKIFCNYIDGLYIIQGDIVIRDDTKISQNSGSLRAAMNNEEPGGAKVNLWDEGKVYFFKEADGLNAAINSDIYSAMQKIQSVTNIKFIELTTAQAREYKKSTRIRFVPSDHNASKIGLKIFDNFQDLWLNKSGPSALHEICHALGLMHEHVRPDRDNFVTVIPLNIQSKYYDANFTIYRDMKFFSDFDFESVMMYDSWAFSAFSTKDGKLLPTIVKKDDNSTFGCQRIKLTDKDIQVLRQMYPDREATPDVFIHWDNINPTSNSCELTAELIYEGYPAITEFDILYREVTYPPNDTYHYNRQTITGNNNIYPIQLTNLSPNTLYEVRVDYPVQNGYKHPMGSQFIQFTTAPGIYTITASVDGTGGSITPNGEQKYEQGYDATFDITAHSGYEIDKVLVDDVDRANEVSFGQYIFKNVTENHTITVSFKEIPPVVNYHTITAFASTGGKIDPSGEVPVEEGKDQKFTFTPNAGYEIAYVLIDEHNNPSAVAAGEYTFPSVTDNHTITVTFKENSVVPTGGLVAYYPFNGNANDESGNGNNGIVNGGVSLTTDRKGNPNSAYYFDGINGYIDCGNADMLKFYNEMTISVWVKLEDGGTITPRIISFEEPGYNIVCNTTNKRYFGVRFVNTYFDSEAIYESDTWYHIIMIHKDNSLKLYVNGNMVNSSEQSPTTFSNYVNNFNIGRKSCWNYDQFKGIIDDIRLYNRALSDSEIQALYNE